MMLLNVSRLFQIRIHFPYNGMYISLLRPRISSVSHVIYYPKYMKSMQGNYLIVTINTRDDITINGFHGVLTDEECRWRVILWLYNQTITWTVFVFVMLCYILLLDMQGSNLNVFSMYINKHFYSWCKNTLFNFCKQLQKN